MARRLKALLIDDEPLVRDVVAQMLRLVGVEVIVAEDGRTGICQFKLRSRELDLVIIDRTMPDLDGEEVLRCIKGIRSDINVIMSSGFFMAGEEERFLRQGVVGCLKKPFTPEVLFDAIEQI